MLLKIFRTEEKRALGNLNDRLASYIDKVRSLEQDKGRLQNQVTIFVKYLTNMARGCIFCTRLIFSLAAKNISSRLIDLAVSSSY